MQKINCPTSKLLRVIALASIRLYQTYLSPLKGFSCAYRKHTGRASCSMLGYRAIRRYGLIAGMGILRVRLACCHAAYREIHPRRYVPQAQQGSCDVPCDVPCDGLEFSDLLDVCDCLNFGSCKPTSRQSSCRKRRKSRQT